MSHAITFGDILFWVGIPLGLLAIGAICLVVLSLLNPFRSGH